MMLESSGHSNTAHVGHNVTVNGKIYGNNNRIIIGHSEDPSLVDIFIHGDNNSIIIDRPCYLKGLAIRCGNHIKAHNTELTISESISIEAGGVILLYNSGNICRIGKNSLFSNNLTIRCGESPHLIFDKESGEYLDISEGVFIGDHAWVGEHVYVTKRATIPSECIVAAHSVVSKRFEETHCVLAGNPARVVKRNVQWVRNPGELEDGSAFKESYERHHSQFPKVG